MNNKEILDILREKGYMQKYYNKTLQEQFSSYFFKPYGIHGILHAKRVLLLSLALSHFNNLSEADTAILATASLYHDIGRTNDGVCFEHGKDSIQKALDLGLINGDINEENEILRYVIINHCLPDDQPESLDKYSITNRERTIELLKLFKDSDGLDRLRINDLNVEYLRSPVSKNLVSFAKYLLKEIK